MRTLARMRQVSYAWIALLLILAGGILLDRRSPLSEAAFRTGALENFPYRVDTFNGMDIAGEEADGNRREHAPSAIVFRQYSDGKTRPINAFIAPAILGVHSPADCLRYSGWVISEQKEVGLTDKPLVRATEVLAVSPSQETNVCVYYWKGRERRAVEASAIGGWVQSRIRNRGDGEAFLVNLCTVIETPDEASGASDQLLRFISHVDPILDGAFMRQKFQAMVRYPHR